MACNLMVCANMPSCLFYRRATACLVSPITKLGLILNLANIMFAHAGCGPECTHDGLHYSNATYDAALQIWMNSLLVD